MTRRIKTADSGFGYQYVNGTRFYSNFKEGWRYVDRRAPPEPGNHDEGGRRWRCIPIQVLHGKRVYSDDWYQWRIDRRAPNRQIPESRCRVEPDWRSAPSVLPVGSFSGRCACEHDGNTVTKPCNMHLDWRRHEIEQWLRPYKLGNKNLYGQLAARDRALDLVRADLRAALTRENGLANALDSVHVDLKAARDRVARLEQVVKNQRATIVGLRDRGIADNEALRELERKQFVGAV